MKEKKEICKCSLFCETKFRSYHKHLIYFSWHLQSRYTVAYVILVHIFPPGHSFVYTPSAVNLYQLEDCLGYCM